MLIIVLIIIAAVLIFKRQASPKSPEKEVRQESREDDWQGRPDKHSGDAIIAAAGTPDPKFGFMNMGNYSVRGLNPKTNRRKKASTYAFSEEEAVDLIRSRTELQPPYESWSNYTVVADKYENDYGIPIPKGATTEDALRFINSIEYGDRDPMTRGLFEYMATKRIPASRLEGPMYAISAIIQNISGEELVAFYAYSVDCNLHKQQIGNILESPKYQTYQAIAKEAVKDPNAIRSLKERQAPDYLKPHKGTTVYKFVIDKL